MVSKKLKQASGVAALLFVAVVLASCGPSPQEVDARIATAIAAIPTPTPQPTATPPRIPSWDEIGARISEAIAAIPTPTPQPTAPPPRIPSWDEIDARVSRAIAAIPTATPVPPPALVTIASSASGTSDAILGGGLGLRVDPGRPVAGRNIGFTISGLKPWQRFSVRFYDPGGSLAQWITSQELVLVTQGGAPDYDQTFYADALGQATWTRVGTTDEEGAWSVRVKVDESEYTATYTVSQLQLDTSAVRKLGLDFRHYQGAITDSYASALVPTSLAVDLQAHLHQVVMKLGDRLALQSQQIPDIYLLGNQALFEVAAKAAGTTLAGWEGGFHSSAAASPGIYVRAGDLATQLKQTMTHEYVHLLLGELASKAQLPAWVNEGVATYYELSLGLELPGAQVTRREVYRRADNVRTSWVPLTALESQRVWNQETVKENVSLHYSEAYMAVRYLVERFGEKGLIKLLGELGNGASLDAALGGALGVSYAQFQVGFLAWVQGWQDARREAVRSYVNAAYSVMQEWESIADEREKTLGSGNLTAKAALLARAKTLESGVGQLTPPTEAMQGHAQFSAFLKRVVEWLQLEQEHLQTGNDAKRVAANTMIPEINGRENWVYRALHDLRVEYYLN